MNINNCMQSTNDMPTCAYDIHGVGTHGLCIRVIAQSTNYTAIRFSRTHRPCVPTLWMLGKMQTITIYHQIAKIAKNIRLPNYGAAKMRRKTAASITH